MAHLCGIFIDFAFIFVVQEKVSKVLKTIITILMGCYTLAFIFWLIFAHVIRFRHSGKVCSGDYLPEGSPENELGYAQVLGKYVLNIIIVMWALNCAIAITNVVTTILFKKKVE